MGAVSSTATSAVAGRPVVVVDRESGKKFIEKVPLDVRIKLYLLHRSTLGSLVVRSKYIRSFLSQLSKDKGLDFDDPESRHAIPKFIEDYGVSTVDLELPLESFKTLNEFFYRALNPLARPIASPADGKVLVQPCDCRLMVFDRISTATKLWIKGRHFTLEKLLDDAYSSQWDECSAVLSRLAPQDYHRFHMPCPGTIKSITDVKGEYYSVKPVVVNSDLDVLGQNKRCVVEFTSPSVASFVMVIIGAAEVGSICLNKGPTAMLEKGEELGYFAYGGSTVLTLFRRGQVEFDAELLQRSLTGIETLVRMGSRLGMVQ